MSQSGPNSIAGSGAAPIETLTGNSGGAVGPDGAFNIDVLGNNSTGIDIVGSPGSSLLTVIGLASSTTQVGTVELATAVETGTLTDTTRAITPVSLEPILVTPYVVAPGGAYTTIQSALDAANAAGGGEVFVRSGSYTENLTLYDNINLHGVLALTSITGVHTPPSSGTLEIQNITLISATDILSSAAAGTTNICLQNCFFIITNGYVYNIPNWTGELLTDNCGEASTESGFINNSSGTSNIKVLNTEAGAGSSNTMQINASGGGFLRFDTVNINCPIMMGGAGSLIFQNGVKFANTVTIGGSLSGFAIDTNFRGGSSPALVYNSSGDLTISCGEIQSTNNPAIGGTGVGSLTLTGCSFPDNANIAGTLTLGSSSFYPVDLANGELLIGSAGQPAVASPLTAGTNITITNGAGSITIDANGGGILAVTSLDDTDSPYTVLSTDEYLSCDVALGVLTIELPDAPTTGRVLRIKDSGGDAATNNITVTTTGGAVLIDGATTFVMNTNYESISVIFNGTSYEVF